MELTKRKKEKENSKSDEHVKEIEMEREWEMRMLKGHHRSTFSWVSKDQTWSLTQWAWVWVNSGSLWQTARPGVLQSLGSQRVGHNWATELNWTELKLGAYSIFGDVNFRLSQKPRRSLDKSATGEKYSEFRPQDCQSSTKSNRTHDYKISLNTKK